MTRHSPPGDFIGWFPAAVSPFIAKRVKPKIQLSISTTDMYSGPLGNSFFTHSSAKSDFPSALVELKRHQIPHITLLGEVFRQQ